MTRDEWIAAFAERIGVERPSIAEIRDLLELAGEAAHGSERTAAPLACWLAGRSGRPAAALMEAARAVATQAAAPEE